MRAYVLSLLMAVSLTVSACTHPGQNVYGEGAVGVSHAVQFGTGLHVREVTIHPKNTGIGALGGAAAGAGGGSYIGNGSGNAWATAGGAVIGAAAGYFAEEGLMDRKGYQYVVNLQSGETKTIVQEQHDEDVVFKAGDHVMLEYCDEGDHAKKCDEQKDGYQRLYPIDKLPPYVKKKRKFVQTKETGEYSNDPDVADDKTYETR